MEQTERLALPLLAPGQAQKELFHNEALLLLDCLVAAAIEGAPSDDPPQLPVTGSCYIVGNSPSGDWSQYPAHLAAWTSGGWRFVAPVVGLAAREISSGRAAVYTSAGWEIGTVHASRLIIDGDQVIGPRMGQIADPAGGATVDTQARSAVASMLAALRQHGLISP